MGNSKQKSSKENQKTDFLEECLEGYGKEYHEIISEDGYILTLMRIFKKEEHIEITKDDASVNLKNKPVVLVVHGFLCKAEHWCMVSPDKGLPYKLLNDGFDCWLANLRGAPSRSLSRGHVSLSTKSKEFWDFSFHEMGMFDLPAMINYILELTGNDSLSYIGHSMGNAILLLLLATKPEYCSKVNVVCALAPAFYGKNIRNLAFKPLLTLGNILGASKFIRTREVCHKPTAHQMKYISPKSKRETLGGLYLKIFGNMIGAFSLKGIEKERLKKFSSEWPCPTSMKLFCHGAQCISSDKATQYNYGRTENMKVYGQPNPPEYDISKIFVKIATFCSEGDELSRPLDVLKLSQQLPNSIGHYYIEDKSFAHIDFMVGKDAHEFVYKKVSQILNEYRK